MSITIPLIGGPKCGVEVAFQSLAKAPPILHVTGGACGQVVPYVLQARAVRADSAIPAAARAVYRFMGTAP